MLQNNASEKFYDELIEFAFNREGDIDSWAWNSDLQEPETAPDNLAVAICRLCINSGKDLDKFNNKQIAGGLKYIFDSSFSNYSSDLLGSEVPPELRHAIFRNLQALFENCFAQRCSPELSHGLRNGLDNPLNEVCYMFWDTSQLSGGGHDALTVMESSLYLKNIACIESGLHGLGHAYYKNKSFVETAITDFLKSDSDMDERLLNYAINARQGYVN